MRGSALFFFAALSAFAVISASAHPSAAAEWAVSGAEPAEVPSRPVIVSYQVENESAAGNALAMARATGAVKVVGQGAHRKLVYGMGAHHKSYGLLEQAKAIYELTGQKVAEIHSLGHTQSGFVAEDDYWQLLPGLAAQLKRYVTDDVRIVFHGCSATRQGGYMNAFLNQLPEHAEIYGHGGAAQPGEPFDWYHWARGTDAAGKPTVVRTNLGKEPVIDSLLPRLYVQWWCELNVHASYEPDPGKTAFQVWLGPGFNTRIPSDVEEMMRTLLPPRR